MGIFFIKNNHIRSNLWNRLVNEAINGYEFHKTWYLNIVLKNWYAVIVNDFYMAMPVSAHNFGILKLITTPPFIPYLGIISRIGMQQTDLQMIKSTIPKNFIFLNYRFNKLNTSNSLPKTYFYSLNLLNNYKYIFENYSKEIKQTIKKNNQYEVYVAPMPIMIKNFLIKNNFLPEKYHKILQQLISESLLKQKGTVYIAYNKKEEIVGFAYYLISENSADLIFLASLNNDKNIATLLIDKFVKKNAQKPLQLNFTCSFCKQYIFLFSQFATDKFYVNTLYNKKAMTFYKYLNLKEDAFFV